MENIILCELRLLLIVVFVPCLASSYQLSLISVPLIPELLLPFFHKLVVVLLPESIHPSIHPSFSYSVLVCVSVHVPLNADSLLTGKPPIYAYSPKFVLQELSAQGRELAAL